MALAKAGLSVTRKRFADIAEEFAQSIELAAQRGEKEPYHARQYPPIVGERVMSIALEESAGLGFHRVHKSGLRTFADGLRPRKC